MTSDPLLEYAAAIQRGEKPLVEFPEHRRFEQLCSSIANTLAEAGVTPAEVLSTLPAVREELYRKHYGQRVSDDQET